jgi:hypothetical protein
MLPGQLTPDYPGPRERPTSVTVIAVLAIVFGGLGLLCTPFSVLRYFTNIGGHSPLVEAVRARPVLLGWTLFASCTGLLFSLVLVIAGIGALSLKRWARILLIAEATASILFGLLNTALTMVAIFPALREMGGPAVIGGLGGGFCALLFGLLVNGLILFFMTRPHVKAAFAG